MTKKFKKARRKKKEINTELHELMSL